jgi:hypothetical protein
MSYRGHIKAGVAVVDEPIDLPDGTPVRIEVEPIGGNFWRNRNAEELAREQGVAPCANPGDLAAEWPADESLDDFLGLIRRSRV